MESNPAARECPPSAILPVIRRGYEDRFGIFRRGSSTRHDRSRHGIAGPPEIETDEGRRNLITPLIDQGLPHLLLQQANSLFQLLIRQRAGWHFEEAPLA
jgi:hypothetical protein